MKNWWVSMVVVVMLIMTGCRHETGKQPVSETQIMLKGGTGLSGGHGGVLIVETFDGGIKIGGKAPRSSIEAPDLKFHPDFGPTPAVFTEDTVVPVLESDDEEPEAGTYYLEYNQTALFRSDGDGNLSTHEIASGLDLKNGVRLTLGLNVPVAGAADGSSVAFDRDVRIGGTLTVPLLADVSDGLDRAALTLRTGHFLLTENGTIDLWGKRAAIGSDEAGGRGGILDLIATNDLILLGRIDASGAEGDAGIDGSGGGKLILGSENGVLYLGRNAVIQSRGANIQEEVDNPDAGHDAGNGGSIILSGREVYAFGMLNASGGAIGQKSTGNGGQGGFVLMKAAILYNDALIESVGGKGVVSGGKGGGVILKSSNSFSGAKDCGIFSKGTIDVRGGVSDRGGSGGNGGEVWFTGLAQTRGCMLDGKILAFGGDAIDSKDLNSSGGRGGYVYFFCEENSTERGQAVLNAYINMSGGNGVVMGGYGGIVTARAVFAKTTPPYSRLYLSGYRNLILSGREGVLSGGGGGLFMMNINSQNQESDFSNRANLIAEGGDAVKKSDEEENVSGRGGNGGMLRFNFRGASFGEGENSGNLYFSGGDSYGEVNNSNGGNGEVCVDNPADFTNTGRSDFRAGEGGLPGTGTDGNLTVCGS